jgi:two-component system, response regulator RegA
MKNYKAILIAEDDEALAGSLERSFMRQNYEVKIANNVKEALNVLKTFHPRYAVVDLKMNGESGLSLVKHLHEFDKSIKIVVLTGYASITTTIEAIKLGACYYLAKPANADMIIEAFGDEVKNKETQLPRKKTSIKNVEWEYINQALIESDFNISQAAKTLGMHRRTLARKLEKKQVQT